MFTLQHIVFFCLLAVSHGYPYPFANNPIASQLSPVLHVFDRAGLTDSNFVGGADNVYNYAVDKPKSSMDYWNTASKPRMNPYTRGYSQYYPTPTFMTVGRRVQYTQPPPLWFQQAPTQTMPTGQRSGGIAATGYGNANANVNIGSTTGIGQRSGTFGTNNFGTVGTGTGFAVQPRSVSTSIPTTPTIPYTTGVQMNTRSGGTVGSSWNTPNALTFSGNVGSYGSAKPSTDDEWPDRSFINNENVQSDNDSGEVNLMTRRNTVPVQNVQTDVSLGAKPTDSTEGSDLDDSLQYLDQYLQQTNSARDTANDNVYPDQGSIPVPRSRSPYASDPYNVRYNNYMSNNAGVSGSGYEQPMNPSNSVYNYPKFVNYDNSGYPISEYSTDWN